MEKVVRFECINPILRVENIAASLRFYVDLLGFENAPWGDDEFTNITKDATGIYLCQGAQGNPGTWIWVGVDDVNLLYEQYQKLGVKIRMAPTNFPWALEMHVEDPDGHILRLGSDGI